jgi:hypothetical protein
LRHGWVYLPISTEGRPFRSEGKNWPSPAKPSQALKKKTNPEVVVAVRMSGKLAQKRGCMVNIYIKGFLNPET